MTFLNTLGAVALSALFFAPGLPAGAQPAGCPPGLAKKSPSCVPPGQAKKGVTAQDRSTHDRTGKRVDPDDVDWIDDVARLDLPPLSDGRRYAVIDGTLVALDPESYEIIQILLHCAPRTRNCRRIEFRRLSPSHPSSGRGL